jgi:hypothetical protein
VSGAADRKSGDSGERDNSDVSRDAGTDDGDTKRSTATTRDRGETSASTAGSDNGDGGHDAERSSSPERDNREAATRPKQEPSTKALAVAEPDKGSDKPSEDAADPALAQTAPIVDD